MLTGIDPILTGRLLDELDRLGHGDELVIADANYPAHSIGVPVIELPLIDSPRVTKAIRSVIPPDDYEAESVLLMTSEDAERPDVQHQLIAAAAVAPDRVGELERFAFYERANTARLVIRTGEPRSYGNLILRKGIVRWNG
ncbi:transport protein RbsD/FucU [Agromyces atrinae]|uniref:RbsD/FucU family protein n=1 Tax=Agromyces atrinae TaxID=592376 RepID=UPI001F58E23E|nr:RbsD/FucU domain-containing protein [Agromyces atrinae]MCI2959458.1 transport protein RbsD/FucU [Agromyces atrinae]